MNRFSTTFLCLRRNAFKTSRDFSFFKKEQIVPNFLDSIQKPNHVIYRNIFYKYNNFSRKDKIGKYFKIGMLVTLGFCVNQYVQKLNLYSTVKALSIPKHDDGQKPPTKNSNNFIADVVEKVASAVVYIEIIGRHPFTNQQTTLSNGSGFIVESDGLILTNAHVIGNARSVICKLYDGRVFNARVEDRDLQKDLATLKISATDLPTIKLGDSSKLRPGEWVVAMGSPLSLSNTITAGVISSVHRGSEELGLPHKEMEYIQTDASINFGNSGGPLVNLDGEAIGINTMKVTAGISFAIPANYAKIFLENSKAKIEKGWFGKKTEQPKRLYLGITMLTLTPHIIAELQQKRFNFPHVEKGVLIWKIVLDSPAHQAGLQPGDVLTHINKKEIVSSDDIYKAINDGNPIKFTVRREHNFLEITVLPEEVV